jgi:hypothetical protein
MKHSHRTTTRGFELAGLGLFAFCTYCAQRPDPPAQTIAALAPPQTMATAAPLSIAPVQPV